MAFVASACHEIDLKGKATRKGSMRYDILLVAIGLLVLILAASLFVTGNTAASGQEQTATQELGICAPIDYRGQYSINWVSKVDTGEQILSDAAWKKTEEIRLANEAREEAERKQKAAEGREKNPPQTQAVSYSEIPTGQGSQGSSGGNFIATAYCLEGTTANGMQSGPGIIAVDPSIIPLGSSVFVSGYGSAIAADTGGAIVGNRIDVWLPCGAAIAWGVRSVSVSF